jgi:hypothetical protein
MTWVREKAVALWARVRTYYGWEDVVVFLTVILIVGIALLSMGFRFNLTFHSEPLPKSDPKPVKVEAPVIRVVTPVPANTLGFIVVALPNGRPLIYEAIKGAYVYRSEDASVEYTNSEGVARRFTGQYFYSTQPLKLAEPPLITTQTSGQFRGN